MPYTNTRRRGQDTLIPVVNEHRYPVGRRLEICEADSENGLWHFEMDESLPRGTRWRVEYRPTGQDMYFGSLYGARQWAGNPLSLDTFRQEARRLVNSGGRLPGLGPQTAGTESVRLARLRRARAQLAILDGRLLSAYAPWQPTTTCLCGGLLTPDNGPDGWAHVDVCDGCWSTAGTINYRCRNVDAHQFCTEPNPVICDHPMCLAAHDLHTHPCTAGHPVCCGCCHGED